jgi:hypothetical protein
LSNSEGQVQPAADPLNKGGGVTAERSRDANELIQTEWNIVDALIKMADNSQDENKKAFYYQTLMGHVRTLSVLLKMHGQPDATQDLAKILSEITKEARSYCKRLKQK